MSLQEKYFYLYSRFFDKPENFALENKYNINLIPGVFPGKTKNKSDKYFCKFG
uniref:Nischarin n=1 Tax=Gloeothece verrucosa (strain PCC 7822) TaxID=497965 RepID=E0UNG2_GLOV7|nr:nischarin [Gloeothece verrucosa PCC 7822]